MYRDGVVPERVPSGVDENGGPGLDHTVPYLELADHRGVDKGRRIAV